MQAHFRRTNLIVGAETGCKILVMSGVKLKRSFNSVQLTHDYVIVNAHSSDEDDETEELEGVEGLPADGD